jgi:hypothetical protein
MRLAAWLLVLATNPVPAAAAGIDLSVSGFGTVGYAQSDQPYGYQRFIDDSGTFWRDTLAGLQIDARFADKFGATAQFKLAPATNNDDEYKGTVSWAFVSWRPANDWLVRAGRQRIPLYLYSQTHDVGVTYDFARLPTEMYSISPNNDLVGLALGKTWGSADGELALDAFLGKFKGDFRFWLRDDIPAVQSSGPSFAPEDIRGGGLVLTYKRNEDTYRIGLSRVVAELRDGTPFPTDFPFVTLAPGIGYYQVSDMLPGPGVPTRDSLTVTVVTLGAEQDLGSGFRVIGELARTFVPDTDISVASMRGYVSLLKRAGQWTPYVVYAFLRSQPDVRNLYASVNYNTVPDFIPGAALINAAQRSGADHTFTYDQSSWAVGTSYAFSPTSKLKAEYLRTHIGDMSTLVDAPSGSNIRNQNINVFSLSYNFVF